MKKVFGIILSLVLGVSCLGLLAGCGDEKYVSVDFWHYYTGEQGINLTKYIETFNNTVGAKKKIIINEVPKGSLRALQDALALSAKENLGAEAMPDMFMAYTDTALSVHKLKPLANIDAYFSDKELGEYVSGYVDEGRIDGGVKVFPVAKATEILTVNETYFEDFMAKYNASHTDKVDWSDFNTIEGITALGKKYHTFTGKALYARDATDNYFFSGVKQQGKDLFAVDGQHAASIFEGEDKTQIKKLWDNYYVPYINGWFSHNGKYGTDCLYTGETIAATGSTSSAYYIKEKVLVSGSEGKEEDVSIRILPAPVFAGGQKVFTQQGAGICVTKSDAKKEKACVEFIKWFTEADRNIEFSGATGYLPVKTAANDIEKIKAVLPDDTAEVFIDVLEESVKLIAGSDLMYACRPFDNSTSARDIFKYGFSDKCKNDYTLISDTLKAAEKLSGAEKDAKLREAEGYRVQFLSEETFEEWWQETKSKLADILGK